MEKKKKAGRVFWGAAFLTALVVFVVSAGQLVSIYRGYKKGTDEYSRLSEAAEGFLNEAEAKKENQDWENRKPEEGKKAPWTVFYDSMKEKNEDYVGWIQIEGTKVDYPIVKGPDNDYYLSHTFEKTENAAGTLFADCSTEEGLEGKHVIIYGHNMKNGSMFAGLKKFREKEFFESHRTFRVCTETGFYTYEIFSVSITAPDSDTYTTEFPDPEAFADYADKMKRQSLYDTEVVPGETDRVMTLSTCVNHNEDRLVVQARRLES